MAQQANDGIVLGEMMLEKGPMYEGLSGIWVVIGFGVGSSSKPCEMLKADFRQIFADWWLLKGNMGVMPDVKLWPPSERGVDRIEPGGDDAEFEWWLPGAECECTLPPRLLQHDGQWRSSLTSS